MAPTGQYEGDIQGLCGGESKLERCQLATGNMNCARIRCQGGQYWKGCQISYELSFSDFHFYHILKPFAPHQCQGEGR